MTQSIVAVGITTQRTTAIDFASWVEEKTTQIYSYCYDLFKSIEQSYLKNRANGCTQEMIRSFKKIEELESEIKKLESEPGTVKPAEQNKKLAQLNKHCRNFLQQAQQLQGYANSYSNDYNEIDAKFKTVMYRLGNTDLGINLQNDPLLSRGSPLMNLRKLFITEQPPYKAPGDVRQLLAEWCVEYNVLALSLVSSEWQELTNQKAQNTLSHFTPIMQKYLLGFSPPLSPAQLQIQAEKKILEELKLLRLDPKAIQFNRNDLSTYQRAEKLIEAKNFCLFYAAVQHAIPVCPNDERKILQNAEQCRELFNTKLTTISAHTFILEYQDFKNRAGTFTRLPKEITSLTNLSHIRYETTRCFGHASTISIDWQRDRDGRFISAAKEFGMW